MNMKGNVAIAGVILVVTALIGVVILDGVTADAAVDQDRYTEFVAPGSGLWVSSIYSNCGTTPTNCSNDVANETFDVGNQFLWRDSYAPAGRLCGMSPYANMTSQLTATNLTIPCTYTSSGMASTTAKTVLNNVPLIAAVGLLLLAGGWLFMR